MGDGPYDAYDIERVGDALRIAGTASAPHRMWGHRDEENAWIRGRDDAIQAIYENLGVSETVVPAEQIESVKQGIAEAIEEAGKNLPPSPPVTLAKLAGYLEAADIARDWTPDGLSGTMLDPEVQERLTDELDEAAALAESVTPEDRCPTCGSDDPAKRWDGTVFKFTFYGRCPDEWHTDRETDCPTCGSDDLVENGPKWDPHHGLPHDPACPGCCPDSWHAGHIQQEDPK